MTTRRDRGTGSISQRSSDGMWRGQIDVGYRNGKRQRKTVYAKTRKECQRRLDAARDAVRAGDVTTSSMKTEKWLRYWLTDIVATKVKPLTLMDYRSKTELYLIPSLGRHRLDKLTPQHVRTLHLEMLEAGRSPTTVNHTHWVLSNALRAAMTDVGLSRNVAALVDPPGAAETEGAPLTGEECRRVLDKAGADRARWAFSLYTGCRQGEVLGLRWEFVDLEAGTADIAWSLQRIPYTHGCHRRGQDPTCGKRAGFCPKRRLVVPPGLPYQQLDGNLCLVRPKTKGSIRVVDLVPGVVHALRELRARDTGPNPHGLVFHRPNGRPLDGRIDYVRWRALLEAAGVSPRPLHSARHTAATFAQAAGIAEAVQMQMLGHTQATTTRGYAHVDRTLTRAAALAIAAAIDDSDADLEGNLDDRSVQGS